MLRDGQHALGICISAASGTDIIKVGKEVSSKIEEIESTRLPAGVKCEKVFYQPDRVSTALGTFLLNLVESVLLVIVLLVFCMNFRSGLILGITLVITVLGMVPLLFDDMFGSLAAAIMGGLIAGTIIVLIIIPVLYSMFYKIK